MADSVVLHRLGDGAALAVSLGWVTRVELIEGGLRLTGEGGEVVQVSERAAEFYLEVRRAAAYLVGAGVSDG